jgi:hypothetical protein
MSSFVLPERGSYTVPEGGNDYLVVVTTYPTTYGANSGVERTEREFLMQSDVDTYGPDGCQNDPDKPVSSFKEYKDAVACAREILNNECYFTDHGYPADAEPPFDSADFKNYDNDEEVLIAVMTNSEFGMMMQHTMQVAMGLIDSQGNLFEQPK